MSGRRIKKIVREPYVEVVSGRAAKKELSAMRAGDPFPNVPAGRSRRGAITTQKVTVAEYSTPRVVEGYITLAQLASARGIQSQLARLWVKAAGIKKPAAGWRWKEGSRELTRIRKVLKLEP